MEPQILEGTWEDILRQAPNLAGKRVRVTILSDKPSTSQATETLDRQLQGRVGTVNFQPSDLSQRTSKEFTEILAEKYRTQNLK